MNRFDPHFNTFAAAIDAAKVIADNTRAVLAKPADLWNICQEPLSYGDTRRISLKLETFQGKPTKKYFHVTIYRLDSGHYELTAYTL